MSYKKFWTLLVSVSLFLLVSNGAFAANVVESGKEVSLHYVMKIDGEIVDSTENKPPLSVVYGQDPLLPGIYDAIAGLREGDKKEVALSPDKAFGEQNPQAIVEVPKENFGEHPIEAGAAFVAHGPDGNPLKAIIVEVKDTTVIVDFNHPLAGSTLNVELEIVSVK